MDPTATRKRGLSDLSMDLTRRAPTVCERPNKPPDRCPALPSASTWVPRDHVDQSVAARGLAGGSRAEGVRSRLERATARRGRGGDSEFRAIAAGIDPAAHVEAINTAQAERAAAHAEFNDTPKVDLMAAAEVHARIDSLGYVAPSKMACSVVVSSLTFSCEVGANGARPGGWSRAPRVYRLSRSQKDALGPVRMTKGTVRAGCGFPTRAERAMIIEGLGELW